MHAREWKHNIQKLVQMQLDITAPEHGVQVRYDMKRQVLYVDVDGITALRICRIPGEVRFELDGAPSVLQRDEG